MLFFDHSTNKWTYNAHNLKYGIIKLSNSVIEMGYYSNIKEETRIIVDGIIYTIISYKKIDDKDYTWNNRLGAYYKTSEDSLTDKYIYGMGDFPYSFRREYGAKKNSKLFKNAQTVTSKERNTLAPYLKYSVGLEFETSGGYIPQHECFKNGLIPLRDGSISGIEYATTVLKSNKGLNLLKQQVECLKNYTIFNKECSLHMHFGGFPLTREFLYTAYTLFVILAKNVLPTYIPAHSFETSKYKANGKNYCSIPPLFNSFEELYEYFTETKYLGSLTQAHHRDLRGESKWNIPTRYKALNIINAICYKGPKTLEFRFLRPTYNYNVIVLWIAIFNAILQYAEHVVKLNYSENCDYAKADYKVYLLLRNQPYFLLNDALSYTYPAKVCSEIKTQLKLLQIATQNQYNNNDYCGRDVEFVDKVMTRKL